MTIKPSIAAAALAAFTFAALPVAAAPITVNLTYQGIEFSDSSPLNGTGTATFDDALLAANTDLGFQFPPTDLQGFSLHVFDTLGNSTDFSLADLTGWQLETGATGGIGDIVDLNFFMDSNDGEVTATSNADDLSIEGFHPRQLFLCFGDGDGCGFNSQSGIGVLDLTQISVPEPATLALFGFSLLGLGAVARRRAR